MDDSIKPITNQGFFSYVFKLSKFKQEDLLNIIQYSSLSVIPIILFIYFVKKYSPNITHEDSSLYMFILTFIELMIMIIGIFFIDRIINFIPTFSGKYYETINLTTVIIVFVTLMLLSHAGYRERTAILLYRFDNWFTIDDWIVSKFGLTPKPFNLFYAEEGQYNLEVGRVPGEGRPDVPQDGIMKAKSKLKGKSGSGGTSSSQASSGQTTLNPQISQQYAVPPPLPVQGPSMSSYGGGGGMMQQPVQNFNSMYANTTTPLVGAATPGIDDMFNEPVAANDALGGSSSWSSW
jgi:hypothetical protein